MPTQGLSLSPGNGFGSPALFPDSSYTTKVLLWGLVTNMVPGLLHCRLGNHDHKCWIWACSHPLFSDQVRLKGLCDLWHMLWLAPHLLCWSPIFHMLLILCVWWIGPGWAEMGEAEHLAGPDVDDVGTPWVSLWGVNRKRWLWQLFCGKLWSSLRKICRKSRS